MPNKVDLEWKGEVIKQTITVPEQDISPKMVLDSLDQAKGQINQMEDQLVKIEGQKKQVKQNIESAKAFVKDRSPFEDKCIALQVEKLKKTITAISKEAKDKAIVEADKTIKEDPSAYTPDQKKNMYYVNYQRFLATQSNVANKISNRIIREHLFEKPVFTNPF